MRIVLVATTALLAGIAPAASAEDATPRLVFAQILTEQNRDGAPRGYLCAADPSGARQSRASTAGSPLFLQPAYSRDGSHVAYVRGLPGGGTIAVANADGSNAHTISTGTASGSPAWFPDGSAVVYERHVGGETRLELATLGGPTYELTSGHHDGTPTVSPDDRHIVFASDRASGTSNALDLFSLDVVAGSVAQLTATPDVSETHPDFSPDGSTLVFAARAASERHGHLATMAAGGGPETALTPHRGDARPRWSPDGSLIAFERGKDVWTIRPDGSGARNLTHSPIEESAPAWQPASSTPAGGHGSCAIVGTPGNDVLVGTRGQDFFYDTGGNDVIYGLGGDDVVYDGRGNDTIHGGAGHDRISLGPGRNVAYGDAGNDLLSAGGTNSKASAYFRPTSPQRLYGGGGRDMIDGGSGGDVLDGGADDDVLFGGRGDDRLSGGAGRDVIHGGDGRDLLYAADRTRDSIDGGAGTDSGMWDRGLDAVRLMDRRSSG